MKSSTWLIAAFYDLSGDIDIIAQHHNLSLTIICEAQNRTVSQYHYLESSTLSDEIFLGAILLNEIWLKKD